ncbi:MAG: MlaD family protein [Candidatus Syntrophosphaera sp.]
MKKFYNNIYKTQVKVGLFVVIILAILILGYLWLSNRISTVSQSELKVSFTDVMGLEVGDKVNLQGMEIGRVSKIRAREGDILVTARINRDIKVKKGARFYIENSSLMGGTQMNIQQGGGDGPINLAQIQAGESTAGLMGIVRNAGLIVQDMEAFLREIRGEDGLVEKSSALLDNADSAFRSLDNLALDTKAEIRATLKRVDSLAEELDRIVRDNSASVDSLLQQSPGAMANINSTLDSLRVMSGRLGSTLDSLSTGKGTAGRLINEDELYWNLLDAVAGLDSLVTDIRENPKKYLKISIF